MKEEQVKELIEVLKDYSRMLLYSKKPLIYKKKVEKIIRELRKIQDGK
jgi:predicted nucleotide-binding protein (sugar kinase/HSP70/actin superfamily)